MADREICPLRHQNGNCLPCGGFCTAVNDDICTALQMAYVHGKHDALELLKEQEPQETRFVHHYSRPGVYADLWLHCEKCGGRIDNSYYYKPKYCPKCGRKVKWDG